MAIEVTLITLLAFRARTSQGFSSEFLGLLLWAAVPALLLAVPSWGYKSNIGPRPGPLVAFVVGGISGLFLYYTYFSHYAAGFVVLGFIVQVAAGVFNWLGLRREI
jgi:hypothetical protein